MPRVINTSARVKPFLQISSMAALNGSLPASIPRLVLKLLCPPPENHCYHCIFHNPFSFLSCNVDFYFLRKNIYFLRHALTLLSLSSRKQIFFYLFLSLSLSIPAPSFIVSQAQLSLRKHL